LHYPNPASPDQRKTWEFSNHSWSAYYIKTPDTGICDIKC